MIKYLQVAIIYSIISSTSLADTVKEPDFDENKTNHYLATLRGKDTPLASELIPTLPAALQKFALDYQKVKELKDQYILADLIHPASKACETDETTEYFAAVRNFYLSEELPQGYRLQFLPVAFDKQLALKKRLKLPLPPTHVMYAEFAVGQDPATGQTEIEGWQRFLRKEMQPEQRFYELVKCPTAEDLAAFNAQE